MALPKISLNANASVPRGESESDPKNPGRARTATPGHASGHTSGHEGGGIVPPEMRAGALEALAGALGAERRYWDREAEKWIIEADHATRLRAAETVLAYDIGKPVERQIKLTGSFEGYTDKLEKLLATPEGLRLALAAGLVTEQKARGTKPVVENEKTPKANKIK